MAASSFVPARSSRGARAEAARASARTAPCGAGLAPVLPLPLRDGALLSHPPTSHPLPSDPQDGRHEVAAARRPQLTVVPTPERHRNGGVRRLGAIAAVIALLAVGATVVAGGAQGDREPVVAGHVVLQPGETLWDVALRSAPAGVDPRRQLDTLRRLNGFGPGPLDAWTVVLIPAV